jgi:foldase protein PrsA
VWTACAVAVLLGGAGLAACGGIAEDAAVVRVGDRAISKATVDHWIGVISRGGAFAGFRGKPDGVARERALALLISSNWLIGEAERQGKRVPESVVEQAIVERKREAPEFEKRLHATGQTIEDVKLEMRSELAAEGIREALAERADNVTQRQVLQFYRRNRRLFVTPEVRVTDLLENQPSPSAAAALVRRTGAGPRFTQLAYHEQVTRTPGFMRTPQKVKVVNAIFSAHPGVLSQPMRLNNGWAVFVVRKIVPPRPQPLTDVRAEVETRLRTTRQQRLKTRFDREFTTVWRAKTSCRSGYVGPGCPQYQRALGAYEDPFSARAHPLLSEQGVNGY